MIHPQGRGIVCLSGSSGAFSIRPTKTNETDPTNLRPDSLVQLVSHFSRLRSWTRAGGDHLALHHGRKGSRLLCFSIGIFCLSFRCAPAILSLAHLPCVEGVTVPPPGGISFLSLTRFDKPHSPSATSSAYDPYSRDRPSTARGNPHGPQGQSGSPLILAKGGCDVHCFGSKSRPSRP